jgi:hypothetical protein
MSFLDKILGRGKKDGGEMTGGSMGSDGMQQPQEGMASEPPPSTEQPAQTEGDQMERPDN